MSRARTLRVYQVDVFAERPLEGNPASVVLDADGLSDEEMRRLASELTHSETVFLQAARDETHDVWAQFFTPRAEIPLCGHATLAGQTVFALERRALGPAATTTIRQGSAGGRWEITVSDGGRYAEMCQEPVTFDGALDPEAETCLLEALGVSAEALDPRCPIEIHSTGHAKIIVGLRRRADLDALRPDLRRLAALTERTGIDGFFLFTLDTDRPELTADCRMFAPAVGIAEDPVTGSGQGPLGAYLVRHGLLDVEGDRVTFRSAQGRVMGRPGLAHVTVELEGGVPRRVRVGGRVHVVFRTEIELAAGPFGHPLEAAAAGAS